MTETAEQNAELEASSLSAASPSELPPPVLHVLVVGFHHKKGCTVEYSHPPLMDPISGDPESAELPSQWRHLPSLALPDGSHNYEKDTAYFHLPDLHDPRKNVFGISCFRQMDAARLVSRTADITRGTVQKSVCVLSRLPLYGHIEVSRVAANKAIIHHVGHPFTNFANILLAELFSEFPWFFLLNIFLNLKLLFLNVTTLILGENVFNHGSLFPRGRLLQEGLGPPDLRQSERLLDRRHVALATALRGAVRQRLCTHFPPTLACPFQAPHAGTKGN
jgi:hypothetical protein